MPFNAGIPVAVIPAHLHASLPLPTAVEPRLHPAIECVLLKALAKEPGERFANTTEFIAAWKAALQTAVAEGMLLDGAALEAVPAAPVSAQPFFLTPAPTPALAPLLDASAPPIPAAPGPPHRRVRLGQWQVSPWLAGILGSLLGAVLLLGLAFAVSRLFFPAPQLQPQPGAPQPAQPGLLQQSQPGAPQQSSPQINAIRLQAIASVLNITVAELNAAEAQGQLASDLALTAGMNPDEFQRLVQAEFATLLEAAVTTGAITQPEADQALAQPLFRRDAAP